MTHKFGLKALAISIALVIIAGSMAMQSSTDTENAMREGGGSSILSLMPPPFIGVASASEEITLFGGGGVAGALTASSFDEAGISAYINAGAIDLTQARTAYKSIDTETSEYIIGIVQISGVDESIYPRVYTNKDGWILAYLPKDEPASAIVQWEGYTGGAINRTTLEDGISKVCNATGKNCTRDNVSYYDFRFPDANRMLWVVEREVTHHHNNPFEFTIQTELTVYNGSWSHRSLCDYHGSVLKIDEETISTVDDYEMNYGLYNTTTHLKKVVTHTVELITGSSYGYGEAATIITYKVPT